MKKITSEWLTQKAKEAAAISKPIGKKIMGIHWSVGNGDDKTIISNESFEKEPDTLPNIPVGRCESPTILEIENLIAQYRDGVMSEGEALSQIVDKAYDRTCQLDEIAYPYPSVVHNLEVIHDEGPEPEDEVLEILEVDDDDFPVL